jgi:hypothetical protein
MLSVRDRERRKKLLDRMTILRHRNEHRHPGDDLAYVSDMLQWVLDDWCEELTELESEDRQ